MEDRQGEKSERPRGRQEKESDKVMCVTNNYKVCKVKDVSQLTRELQLLLVLGPLQTKHAPTEFK